MITTLITENLLILEASRQEIKKIIKDIQQNSDHANDYDLMGIYEDIRRLERETEGIIKAEQLCDNAEYVKLSKRSCLCFDIIKNKLPSECIEWLFEYEDIHSQMENIMISRCS